ncbi:MAG: hypothetical protein JRG70_18705, partial [Deltaproteobacteria bacterium]|nr:hypothetical protein [Deltaproteobacteria bacterium]
MKTSHASALRYCMATALSLAVLGCGGGESSVAPAGGGGSGGAGQAGGALVLPGLSFVASAFGFYYPADPETGLNGFNLDDRVSSGDSPAAGECAHDDFVGPDQEPGIDYG